MNSRTLVRESVPAIHADEHPRALCTTWGPSGPPQKPRLDKLKQAPLAQSAERLHGKEKVYGSIP